MMKVTPSLLHIPPYISTSWNQVSFLSYDTTKSLLVVILKDGSKIGIPQLSAEQLKQIFQAHALSIESATKENAAKKGITPESIGLSIPFSIDGAGIEGLGAAMQHNPAQKDSPVLPQEVLEKFAQVSKALGLDKMQNLPEAEPHCNCFHCQLARAIAKKNPLEEENQAEAVSDEELKFRSWDIEQKADGLYIVTNPLDKKEQYQVFLKDPIGCTCGHNDCEHIKAVLHS